MSARLICEVCDKPTGREYAICLDCEEELRAAFNDKTVGRVLRGPDEVDNADAGTDEGNR